MTLSINAIAKDPNANSYTTLADANYHFSTKYKSADLWAALSNDQKSQLLIEATRQLDLFIFGGQKTTQEQALSWPRNTIISSDGYPISNQIVPKQIMAAQCEMANWMLTEDERLLSDIDLQQIDQFKAGPLDLKIKNGAITVPPIVKQLIQSIGPGALIATETGNQAVSFRR